MSLPLFRSLRAQIDWPSRACGPLNSVGCFILPHTWSILNAKPNKLTVVSWTWRLSQSKRMSGFYASYGQPLVLLTYFALKKSTNLWNTFIQHILKELIRKLHQVNILRKHPKSKANQLFLDSTFHSKQQKCPTTVALAVSVGCVGHFGS